MQNTKTAGATGDEAAAKEPASAGEWARDEGPAAAGHATNIADGCTQSGSEGIKQLEDAARSVHAE